MVNGVFNPGELLCGELRISFYIFFHLCQQPGDLTLLGIGKGGVVSVFPGEEEFFVQP
jgi:hypothetical protein